MKYAEVLGLKRSSRALVGEAVVESAARL